MPKSKRKCPACKEPIVPRTLPDGTRALLTPQQADDLAREKHELAEERLLVKRLNAYGVGDQERREVEAELREQWGVVPSRRDVAWAAANRKVAQAGADGDFARLSSLYWHMAMQLYEEGRDHFELSRLSKKYGLLAMQNKVHPFDHLGLRFKLVVIPACPESHAYRGRQYSIEEALDEMPIPRPDCSYHYLSGREGSPGWCVCSHSHERDRG
ncbi:MAG: hypothetical protein JXA87_01285 [Thermoleophilia bacterium]|nr:hypothetical protein [Thermoleophilia bacterium]